MRSDSVSGRTAHEQLLLILLNTHKSHHDKYLEIPPASKERSLTMLILCYDMQAIVLERGILRVSVDVMVSSLHLFSFVPLTTCIKLKRIDRSNIVIMFTTPSF